MIKEQNGRRGQRELLIVGHSASISMDIGYPESTERSINSGAMTREGESRNIFLKKGTCS
jgi:hypothetical protein